MSKNRIAISVAAAAGFIFLFAAPKPTRALGAIPGVEQTTKVPSPGVEPKRKTPPPDDFAGVNFTDEQKAEIDKIHQETESFKARVAKDEKLTHDQKDALLLGYTRMEYVREFKVLSPDQQKQIRQRILARRTADRAKQKPPN
jgi:hypothetical protein